MSDHDITHREIYNRLVALEEKVDTIDSNTAGLVAAFKAAEGAFTVLEFVAKIAKPVLAIGAFAAACGVIWQNWRSH